MRAHSSAGNTVEGKAASQKTVRQEVINGLLLLGGGEGPQILTAPVNVT